MKMKNFDRSCTKPEISDQVGVADGRLSQNTLHGGLEVTCTSDFFYFSLPLSPHNTLSFKYPLTAHIPHPSSLKLSHLRDRHFFPSLSSPRRHCFARDLRGPTIESVAIVHYPQTLYKVEPVQALLHQNTLSLHLHPRPLSGSFSCI